MELRKLAETSATITLGWNPVEGADGYLFYADGKRVSRTFDPRRKTVKFSKGPSSFVVEAVRFARVDAGAYPAAIPPPPPPPPPPGQLAPMTHYKTDRADARYCVHVPGVTQRPDGKYVDGGGFTYSENGLCDGGRSGKFVAELKPADSMDGLEPCDGYTKDGRTFPPWPAASYEV